MYFDKIPQNERNRLVKNLEVVERNIYQTTFVKQRLSWTS